MSSFKNKTNYHFNSFFSQIPNFKQLKYLNKYLSKKEKWLLRISLLASGVSIIFFIGLFFYNHIQTEPIFGGEYIEGVVGSPKYINPLYSDLSDVDNDLESLVFSSLLKKRGNGKIINDLASDYYVSDDGLRYTFKLKKDIVWHNSDPLTVDDVVFTFNSIKDAQYQSPLRATFSGVSLERLDDETIQFVLPEKFSNFLDLMDFGILPQNLWNQVSPSASILTELNLKPVGSGPYQFKSLSKDKLGGIRLYHLTVNENYYGLKPKIKDLTFKFFPNYEEALSEIKNEVINGLSYLPAEYEDWITVKEPWNFNRLNLTQINGIFFNQNKNQFLVDKNIRKALSVSLDRTEIINQLGGNYNLVNGPIINSGLKETKILINKNEAINLLSGSGFKLTKISEPSTEDEKILGQGDWMAKSENGKKEYLILRLTALDIDETKKTTELIQDYWKNIGVKTLVETVPVLKMQNEILKNKNFEALFYGISVANNADLYSFWHSSQAKEGGWNLTGYSSPEADKLLTEIRSGTNSDILLKDEQKLQAIIMEDIPAIFLYSPIYTYVQSKKIKGFNAVNIRLPYERFDSIADWYMLVGRRFKW